MIRTATPEDLPALGPVYAAARRFMAENGNPTQWSDRYPLTEDLEEDIGKGQLYVWAPDGAVHGAFVLQLITMMCNMNNVSYPVTLMLKACIVLAALYFHGIGKRSR